MTDLTEKSLRTLELPRVLERLAGYAASEEAKEKIMNTRPAKHFHDAELWQRQTTAARRMMNRRAAPGFSGLHPVSMSLSRAGMGGCLNTRELLDIAGVLRCARVIKAYSPEEPSCLDTMFKLLQGNKHLEDRISGCVLGEEEIADSASPELASIRRHQRTTNGKIRESLQKYITSPSYSKYLQDTLITQRGDRFVVPVKAEYRGEMPGLVHDVSSSGATLFVEPMAVVKLNNELRELMAKEQAEIERILAELSAECAGFSEGILRDYEILVELDGIFARARLSAEMDAQEPLLRQKGGLSLKRARHPLLPQKEAVPITVRLGVEFDTLVITGPNTGGKTVTLKTIGLLSLMAACGLHIPADSGSEVPLWTAVYADIGDEQSIEQSLSTFSSHMVNIVSILSEAEPGSLALFDELGAGTDPVEGAALAVSIIQHARKLGAAVAATTHYAELKTFALTTAGVENASCEFDVETLKPTYKLLIGVPGKSNAFAISKRLGLDGRIIEEAQSRVGVENAAFEDVLYKLERQRQALEKEKTDIEVLKRKAEEDGRKAAEDRAVWESNRSKAAELARMEARHIVDSARQTADEVVRELGRMRAHGGASNDEMVAMRQKLNEAEDKLYAGMKKPEEDGKIDRPLVAGDTVLLASVGTKATVLTPPDKDGNVALQAGILKITAKVDELRLAEPEKEKKPKTGVSAAPRAPARPECDLRGMTVEEALLSMEMYLDGLATSGLNIVTIIHGKGTGALRAAVHKALRQNKAVKSFRLGRYGEGEAGVTIVELK